MDQETILQLQCKIDQEDNCVICFDGKAEMGIFPCGHVKFCRHCIVKIKKRCPICHGQIEAKFRFFK